MENDMKKVFTDEEMKKQNYAEIVADVVNEMNSRQDNIKTYYPYFEIIKRLKAKSEAFGIDLTGAFMGLLSFLLYTGKLNSKKVDYQDICDFIEYFLQTNYPDKFNEAQTKDIVNTILDEAQNKGNNFVFTYYSLKSNETKEKYIKYIEIKLGENGKLNYYITTQGIDFYLKTKEFPDAAQITINLLLFRKQIEKGAFNYAYDTVKRLNIEVKRKIEQKETILEALMYGGQEGIKEYTRYHESVIEQFREEEELFGEVSDLIRNLYNEYLTKEGTKNFGENEKNTLELIRKIEHELSKTIVAHTRLLHEAVQMTKKHDEILDMRAKSAFSEKFKFEQEFEKLITKTDNPEKLMYFIAPFLSPKKLKSFNPMKSFETQKVYTYQPEEEQKEKTETYDIETIDEITQKRVLHNFKFYFENLLLLLKNKNRVTIKQLAEHIKTNFGEKSLYNADFISFVIYLNHTKTLKADESDIFKEFKFRPIKITPDKEDIDLGNGLKITNIIIEVKGMV